MKLDVGINLKQISKSVSVFMHRYHILIFVCTVIGGLSVATFMLNRVISVPTPQPDTSTTQQTFDKETIKRIQELKKPTEQDTKLNLPAGRTNPFV